MVWKGSKLVFFIAILLSSFSIKVKSQELKENSVDSLWWEQKTEQLDYSEELEEKKERRNMGQDFSWVNNPLVKYSILTLIIIGLLILLFYLFRNDFFSIGGGEKDRDYNLLVEEDLDNRFYEMDLDRLLKEAIAGSNWKLAIRIRFLMLLRSLIAENRIDWHKDLTNLQIIYQMAGQKDRTRFSEIVFDFEKVWYGDQIGSNENFQHFDQNAVAFIQSLKKESKE